MTKLRRLYDNFQPTHYDLDLDIQRITRVFSGTVTITGELKKDSTLRLHGNDLEIKKALVNKIPAEIIYGEHDEITITPSSTLTDTKVTIILEFSGKINDLLHGLYPCYFEHDGQKKELLITQLESHYARELLPCIDEPAAKATFDVTLHTETGVQVLGNMPIKQQDTAEDRLVTRFETSPKMSPYLLAFVIGELHSVSGKTKSGVDVNIWATPAQSAESMQFALKTGIGSIEFFDDYFGTAYPLPKADHVAVPDFSSAAMENWGLMTYREAYLLADTSTAVSTKQTIASVIGHETSHQWFGNLVTMAWWDDLWLNESFANMMQYLVTDSLYPDWKVWNDFASHEGLAALRRDALPGVQAVKVEVNDPEEIGTLFDPSIVYAKGGNLLNMLRSYIGEDEFRKGLKQYFKTHAYSNTTGNDLWKVLAEASGKDIQAFMDTWLTQSGYPIVKATLAGDTLNLKQEHFQIGGGADDRHWPVPLFANDPAIPEILEQSSVTSKITSEYIKLNQNDTSYFVTDYDGELTKRLLKNIDKLSDIDKLQLLNEASLLSKGSMKPTAELVDLLDAYKNETLQPVWDVIGLSFADLKRFSEDDETLEKNLKKFAEKISLPLYQKLGWQAKDGESEDDTKLRATIIGMMLYSENKDATNQALELYQSTKDITQLSGELRAMILGTAVKYSENPAKVIDELLEYHKTTSNSDVQQDIVIGLTSTKDPAVAKKLLSLITDSSIVRPQDATGWYAYMIRNRFIRAEAWDWITNNWAWIKKSYKNDHHYDNFVYYTASAFSSNEYLEKFRDFFEPMREEIALQRTIDIGLSEIASRIEWIDNNKLAVAERLEQVAKR